MIKRVQLMARKCIGQLGVVRGYSNDEFVHASLIVTLIDGKGRGVAAADDIRAGSLLLRMRPLAFAFGAKADEEADDDQDPDPLQLVPMLVKDTSNRTRSWLQILHRGGRGASRVEYNPQPSLDEVNALFQGRSLPSVLPSEPNESIVKSIVMANAFGDRFQDPVLATQRSQPDSPDVSPFVGLWPCFPLLNHSCIPNAVHYCTGQGRGGGAGGEGEGTLIVRASSDIKEGEEVVISYLGGEEDGSPVSLRQDVLTHRFGFQCSCRRCQLEESLPPSLTSCLHNVHKAVKRLQPSFLSAVEEDDGVKLAALSSDLETQSTLLFEALGEFMKSDLSRRFVENGSAQTAAVEPYLLLEASVYELFQVISVRDEIVGADKNSSLLSCLDILGAVSRGSEVDCFLSSRLLFNLLREKKAMKDLVIEEEDGEDTVGIKSQRRDEGSVDEAIQQAAHLCHQAHVARYGSELPREMILKLMKFSDSVGREYL